jgi:hypothetical protein
VKFEDNPGHEQTNKTLSQKGKVQATKGQIQIPVLTSTKKEKEKS